MIRSHTSSIERDNVFAVCADCYDKSFKIWEDNKNYSNSTFKSITEKEYMIASVLEVGADD